MWRSSCLGRCCLLPCWLLGSFQPPELQAYELLNFFLSLGNQLRPCMAAEYPWTPSYQNQEDGEPAPPPFELGTKVNHQACFYSYLIKPELHVPWKEHKDTRCREHLVWDTCCREHLVWDTRCREHLVCREGQVPYLCRRLLWRTILRKPVGSVTELSCLFISSNCCSMMSPASLSVSLLAQALWETTREPLSEKDHITVESAS